MNLGIADQADVQAAMQEFSDAALQIPGVSGPPTTRLSNDETVAMMTYTLAGSQNDVANRDIVREVRGATVPGAFGDLPER